MVAVLAVIPTGQATFAGSGEYRFDSLTVLHVVLQGTLPSEEVASQRALFDTDRDGTVTSREVEESRNQTLASLEGSSAFGLPTGRLLVGGEEHIGMRITRLDYEGAVGPVADEKPLGIRWGMELQFAPGPGVPGIRMDPLNHSRGGHIQMDVTSLVMEMPPGYAVAASGGLPLYASVSKDGQLVVFPRGLGGTSLVILELEEAPEKKSPMAGALLGPAILVGAFVWRRRLRTPG